MTNYSTAVFLRIEAIFNEALDTSPNLRTDLIAARCDGDPVLITEVESLLRASDAEENLTAARRLEPEPGVEGTPERRRIGPYELDRLVGRGGMGAVYLAHRADGQFEQQVAIKLIDLPLATDFFRERFRQERQILAGLQHPYIARLLDGGVSGDGDLYLAMEFVNGVPINRYCEQRQLTIPQRLTLFMGVCEAVQFAHQNLVVHRDLKPDNIMVAEDGTPKLLDFGTAKLVSPSLARQEGDLTRQGYASFTPQYASPEQVLGNPITTASDTYSLGVLLYLLLTGVVPYELKELTTAEMFRVICSEPPRKPGNAVGTKDRLDPDLEAILNKALRKEPQERYRTAEQMAADIQDYLDGRPVAARRGTFRYRAVKFIRRNRLAIAAAGLLAATLTAGVLGVVWQARVANEQRRKAEARSADLRQLSNSLLSELDEAIKDLPGSTGVQKLLVTRVLEHLDRMAGDAQGDRLTELDLIDAYVRLGNIQGNAYDQNLGDPTGGLASLQKARDLAAPLAAAAPNDREALRALASVDQARSEILWQIGKTPEAITAMLLAVANFDALIADPHTTAERIVDDAGAYSSLGDEYGQGGTQSLGKRAEALTAYRKAIDLDNRALSVDPNLLRPKRGLAIMAMKIGTVEMDADPAQALKEFELAMQRTDALPAGEKSSFATNRLRSLLLRKEADCLRELGQYAKAAPLYDRVIEANQRFAAQDADDSRALVDEVVIYDDETESSEDAADPALQPVTEAEKRQNLLHAVTTLNLSANALESLLKRNPANITWRSIRADGQWRLGTIETELQAPGDWQALSRRGLAVLKELATSDQASPLILDQAALAFLTVKPASLRDPQLALTLAEREVALSRRQNPGRLLTLAQACREAGQLEKARATANEGLALLPAPAPGIPKPRVRKQLEMEARGESTIQN